MMASNLARGGCLCPQRQRRGSLAAALRAHWPEYLMEAALLGVFMVSACVFTVLLEHPGSPVRAALPRFLRRGLMGLAMGLTAVAIIYSPWGKRSGAHINPAATLTFWRLGKIARADALFYAVAQCAGAIAGVGARLRWRCPDAARHPAVNFAATLPGRAGRRASPSSPRSLITFLLMTVVLDLSNAPRWNRFTGLAAGICVALFITFEAPLSGMSLNPARSLGSATAAMTWDSLWIYFAAPPLGMLLAAEVRRRVRGLHSILCAKLHHDNHERCIFRCGYPVCGPAGRKESDRGQRKPLRRHPHRHRRRRRHAPLVAGADGQEDPGARARRLRSAREGQLELEGRQRRRQVPDEGVWRDKAGKELHPHTNYYVGGNTKFYGAALFRLRKEDFGEVRHHGGISPAWPISYDELEPYYLAAERLYNVHGERGEDPTDPPASGPYPARPSATSPASSTLPRTSRSTDYKPFHVPLGIMLNEEDRGRSQVHPLRDLRRLSLPRAGQGRRARLLRRAGARAAERHASDEREGHEAPHRRERPRRHEGRGRPQRRPRGVLGGDRRRRRGRDQLGGAAAALGKREAPARARQRLGRRRAPLHGSRQLGRAGGLEVPEPDRVPEDAGYQRLLLRVEGVGVPDGPHLLRRQARRRGALGRRAGDRARASRST